MMQITALRSKMCTFVAIGKNNPDHYHDLDDFPNLDNSDMYLNLTSGDRSTQFSFVSKIEIQGQQRVRLKFFLKQY